MFVCVVHEIPYYHCVYMCLCVQSMKYPTTTVCICVCVCRGMCHGAWKEVRWQVSGISTLFLPLCGIWRWNSGCYAVPGAFAPLSYTTGLFTKSLMSDTQPDKPPSQQVFILSHKAFIWLLFINQFFINQLLTKDQFSLSMKHPFFHIKYFWLSIRAHWIFLVWFMKENGSEHDPC